MASIPLQQYLSELNLVQYNQISLLKNTRIGIDGLTWLRKTSPLEPFQPAMGGVPLSMMVPIKQDLQKYLDHDIKPVIVFSGVSPQLEYPFSINAQRKEWPHTKRVWLSTAWELYYKGDVKSAEAKFQDSEGFISKPFINNVIKYLAEKGVEYFRAPYLSWAQLGYFASPKVNFISAAMGGLELLLFGVHRLILDIDFEKGIFKWVDLKEVWKQSGLVEDQFMDACILAGFDHSKPFPPLREGNQPINFRAVVDIIKTYRTGHAAIIHHLQNPGVRNAHELPLYLESFQQRRAVIRHHLVLLPSGICEPLNKEFCPSDLHEVLGPRLPNDIYFLISQGVINPQAISTLLYGALVETQPLVDSEEYRRIANELIDLRAKTIGLLTSTLNTFYHTKAVVTRRWYDLGATETPLIHWTSLPLKTLRGGKLDQHYIAAELTRQNVSEISLPFVMKLHCEREPQEQDIPTLTTCDEVLYATLFQGLVLRDYLTADWAPTVLGKALEGVSPRFQEECFLILELSKSGYINGSKLQSFSTPKSMLSTPEIPRAVVLLTRVLSVLGMDLAEERWTGPVDFDLLGFHEITRALYRSLRNMLEMSVAGLVMRRAVLDPTAFHQLISKLPFFQQANTAMALVVKAFVSENLSIKQLQERFPQCINIVGDLKKAYEFWDEVWKIVNFLKDYGVLGSNLWVDFESANTQFMSKKHLVANK